MTIGYSICLAAAVGLLIAYLAIVKNRERWLTMLYVCVPVVHLGYLMLSLAKTVEFAVFANDVAYLGSVFLSMCMLLTIVRLCGFEVRRVHVITCVTLGALMFLVIASSPMLPIYYKRVWIETVDGAAKLYKETANELCNLAEKLEKHGRKAAGIAYNTAKKAANEIKEDTYP